jgi:hypothetical protein
MLIVGERTGVAPFVPEAGVVQEESTEAGQVMDMNEVEVAERRLA